MNETENGCGKKTVGRNPAFLDKILGLLLTSSKQVWAKWCPENLKCHVKPPTPR